MKAVSQYSVCLLELGKVKVKAKSMTYFLPHLEPVTKEFTFVRAKPTDIAHGFSQFASQTRGTSVWRTTHFRAANLESAVSRLDRSRRSQAEYLLVPTDSEWTALFELHCGWNGGDINTTPARISYFTPADAIGLIMARDTERAHRSDPTIELQYGSIRFDFVRNGEVIRHVQAMNSASGGGWEFHTFGEPLPKENLSNFSNREIADRFTFDNLVELLSSQFGIQLLDESFYKPQLGCILLIHV